MINKIIEFSMRNRCLILAVYVLVAACGYWALLHTPIDAIPDLSENQVIVFTDCPGGAHRKLRIRSRIP
jgi:Cu(I)/Ag(I) efflux system membrane protein CusA/SilA